jgi:hypothetical protein
MSDPQERLDEVEEHIEQAKEAAQDAVPGVYEDHGDQRFYESGDIGKEEDDQTIAPPG